jgi:hypothetical protein
MKYVTLIVVLLFVSISGYAQSDFFEKVDVQGDEALYMVQSFSNDRLIEVIRTKDKSDNLKINITDHQGEILSNSTYTLLPQVYLNIVPLPKHFIVLMGTEQNGFKTNIQQTVIVSVADNSVSTFGALEKTKAKKTNNLHMSRFMYKYGKDDFIDLEDAVIFLNSRVQATVFNCKNSTEKEVALGLGKGEYIQREIASSDGETGNILVTNNKDGSAKILEVNQSGSFSTTEVSSEYLEGIWLNSLSGYSDGQDYYLAAYRRKGQRRVSGIKAININAGTVSSQDLVMISKETKELGVGTEEIGYRTEAIEAGRIDVRRVDNKTVYLLRYYHQKAGSPEHPASLIMTNIYTVVLGRNFKLIEQNMSTCNIGLINDIWRNLYFQNSSVISTPNSLVLVHTNTTVLEKLEHFIGEDDGFNQEIVYDGYAAANTVFPEGKIFIYGLCDGRKPMNYSMSGKQSKDLTYCKLIKDL